MLLQAELYEKHFVSQWQIVIGCMKMWILWMKIALSWYVWHHRLRTSCRLSSAAYKESLINYTLHNGAVAVWLVHVTQEITKKDMELFICINYAVGNRGIQKGHKDVTQFQKIYSLSAQKLYFAYCYFCWMFDLRCVEFDGKKAVFNFHLLKVRK